MKVAGVGMATLGASGIVTGNSGGANSSSNGSRHSGEPQYTASKKVGYAMGTHQDSVTPGAIRELQDVVLDNRPSDARNGVCVNDPSATGTRSGNNDDSNDNKVLGYGITWAGGAPEIIVVHAPAVQGAHNSKEDNQKLQEIQRGSEERAHDRIEAFVEQGRDKHAR